MNRLTSTRGPGAVLDLDSQREAQIEAAERVLRAHMEQQLRIWRLYLRAKLLTHQALTAQSDDAIVLDIAGDTGAGPLSAQHAAREGQRLLDEVPLPERECFDAYLDTRRRTAQLKAEATARQAGKPLPDADVVYHQLMESLLAEAMGGVDGVAEVPFVDGVRPVEVEDSADGPDDLDFRGMAGVDPRRKRLGLAAVVLLSILGGIWVWRDIAAQSVAAIPAALTTAPALVVNDAPAPLPAWQRLTLASGALAQPVSWALLPSTLTNGAWTIPPDAQASWLPEAVAPTVLCVRETAPAPEPGGVLAQVQAGDILALTDQDGATAQFTVAAAQPEADGSARRLAAADPSVHLLLLACEADGAAPLITARATDLLPPPPQPLGMPVPLASGVALHPQDVRLRSAELDATVPTGTIALDMRAIVTGTTDLAPLAPQLVLADGTVVPATGEQRVDPNGQGQITHLLPATAVGPVAWQVTSPAQATTRWVFDLPLAPTHAAALSALDVALDSATLIPRQEPTITMTLAFRNGGRAPLTIRAGDLQVTQDAVSLVVTPERDTALPLLVAAGESTRLTVRVDLLHARGPLVLQLGDRRWELALTAP